MTENDLLDAVTNMDADVVQRFVAMDQRLAEKKKPTFRKTLLRIASLAACFALIVSAVILMPTLWKDSSEESNTSEESLQNPPIPGIPPVSVMQSGGKLTGKQELTYGDTPAGNDSNADMEGPGFYLRTVVEAQLVEVLPDTYRDPTSYFGEPKHIAKLRVIDQIRGEGVPEEIFVCYSYYDKNILDGYESFILSLEQIGVENYLLINDTQGRVDYFSHMFRVVMADLGYGSVIAFNGGKVDTDFWDKANYYFERYYWGSTFDNMLDRGMEVGYPASRASTVEEVKANIRFLAENDEGWRIDLPYDFVTAEEILTSDDAKAIREYVSPGPTNVFCHWLSMDGQRKIINYTRLINGFLTDEQICVNGYDGEDGEVIRYGQTYTSEDLAKIPNIGEAIAGIDFSSLQPVHREPTEEIELKYADAAGKYYKADGKVYGVIRVRMRFEHVYQGVESWFCDTYYYLYEQNGNGTMMEPEALQELLREDYFLRDHWVGMIAWN